MPPSYVAPLDQASQGVPGLRALPAPGQAPAALPAQAPEQLGVQAVVLFQNPAGAVVPVPLSANYWLAEPGDDETFAVDHLVSRAMLADIHGHDVSVQPLSETRYCQFVASLQKGNRANNGGIRGAMRNFTVDMPKPGKPPLKENVFPKVVNYDGECLSLCRTAVPDGVLSMQSRLLTAMAKCVIHFAKKAADICKVSPTFFIEIVGEGRRRLLFAVLGAAMARNGRHPEKQLWTLCDAHGDAQAWVDNGCVGILPVSIATKPFVPFEGRALTLPISRQRSGAMNHLVSHEMAAFLIRALQPDADDQELICPNTITLRALRCEAGGTCKTLVVKGLDLDFKALVVSDSLAADHVAPLAPGLALALEDGVAVEEAAVAEVAAHDFSDIFGGDSDEETPARARQRRREASGSKKKGANLPSGEADDEVDIDITGVTGPLHSLLGLEETDDIEDLRGVLSACMAAAASEAAACAAADGEQGGDDATELAPSSAATGSSAASSSPTATGSSAASSSTPPPQPSGSTVTSMLTQPAATSVSGSTAPISSTRLLIADARDLPDPAPGLSGDEFATSIGLDLKPGWRYVESGSGRHVELVVCR